MNWAHCSVEKCIRRIECTVREVEADWCCREGCQEREMPQREPQEPKEPHHSHWNYRVMEHWDPVPESLIETVGAPYQRWYGIHEVYYDDSGAVDSYSVNAMALTAENAEDLQGDLERMLVALKKPIIIGKFDSRDIPTEKGK